MCMDGAWVGVECSQLGVLVVLVLVAVGLLVVAESPVEGLGGAHVVPLLGAHVGFFLGGLAEVAGADDSAVGLLTRNVVLEAAEVVGL